MSDSRSARRCRLVLCALIPLAVGCGGGGGGSQTNSPVCSVNTASLSFGSVLVGQTRDLTFTITNTGQGTLAGTVSSPCADYTLQGSASYSLGPGASATLTVRFAPSATGTRTCTLTSGASCANVGCTGVGAATACQITPTALAFGIVTVGTSADRTLTLMNAGSGTLSETVSSPCASYTLQGTASYTLGPGASAVITVRFTPSAGGPSSCTLDTGDALCADVPCSGTGIELNSGFLSPLATFQHTFMTAGSYPYHCEIHTVMRGTVIVDIAGPPSASVSIVSATSTGFSPSSVTVAPGGTVTWTNNHTTTHTVTSD